jgi:hypothetical protein
MKQLEKQLNEKNGLGTALQFTNLHSKGILAKFHFFSLYPEGLYIFSRKIRKISEIF